MDLSDDDLNPWEREEPDAMMPMEDPEPMAEELVPPGEEHVGDEQDEQQEGEKPTALYPVASPDPGPSAVRVQAAVLPPTEPEYKTPEKRAEEEPTALRPVALVAKVMAQGPSLNRLVKKRTVPESVCPMVVDPCSGFRTQKTGAAGGLHQAEGPAKVDYEKQYNWV